MKTKKIQFEGYNYLVIHLYNENQYGHRAYYNVLTNNPKYCASLLPELCGYKSDLDNEGLHDLRYKREPTPYNAFRPYYKAKFVEDNMYETICPVEKDFQVDRDSYYSFEYVEPSMD